MGKVADVKKVEGVSARGPTLGGDFVGSSKGLKIQRFPMLLMCALLRKKQGVGGGPCNASVIKKCVEALSFGLCLSCPGQPVPSVRDAIRHGLKLLESIQ